jgi:hypothetical protein
MEGFLCSLKTCPKTQGGFTGLSGKAGSDEPVNGGLFQTAIAASDLGHSREDALRLLARGAEPGVEAVGTDGSRGSLRRKLRGVDDVGRGASGEIGTTRLSHRSLDARERQP